MWVLSQFHRNNQVVESQSALHAQRDPIRMPLKKQRAKNVQLVDRALKLVNRFVHRVFQVHLQTYQALKSVNLVERESILFK